MNTFSFYASKKYLVKRWDVFFCVLKTVKDIFFIEYSLLKKIFFFLFKHSHSTVKRFSSSRGLPLWEMPEMTSVHITYVNTIYFFFFGTLFPSKWSGVRVQNPALPELKGVKAKNVAKRLDSGFMGG